MKTENDDDRGGYDPNRYAPDLDEHGQDTNRPLDDEETAALNRLDNGQGWLEQGRHFHRLHRLHRRHRPRTHDRHNT